MADFDPTHPGEVLLEEFMKPMGLTQYGLAKALGVTQVRIGQIVHGKRAVSPDTALRLSRFFGTSAEFWMGMQATYDLEVAKDKVGAAIAEQIAPHAA
ncbi:HigA family addiction module antitoxin [Devosia sp. XJ19-1]|uniref:HigA family addiction module antitoxin n=1 Tax=Devosia ureilytica TaxID=2952754 RepID=A0A9Q4AQS4_9HYPH|nr:HigA family addiction module antitoxin [Devosia ureilytica]MCP8884350.1 HigA family addiction module antitoxin [Devosia ureilytica]MCP8887958.1 HigA family addiction module antitoxin [Devosia ureilytica]